MLNLSIPRPGRLDLGRSAAPGNVLTLAGALSPPVGLIMLRAGLVRRLDAAVPHTQRRTGRTERASMQHAATRAARIDALSSRAGTVQALSRALLGVSSAPTSVVPALRSAVGAVQVRPVNLAGQQAASCVQQRSAAHDSATETHIDSATAIRQGVIQSHQPTATESGTLPTLLLDALPFSASLPLIAWPSSRSEQAMPPSHGWRIDPYPPQPKPRQRGRLALLCPRPGHLNIGARCWGNAALRVAIRRSYRVMNTASLVRDSDGADIACSSITLALDRDAWSWSLSASLLGAEAMDVVPLPPAAVRVTVNGYQWRMLIDEVSVSRSFGKRGVSLTGRSIAARLAEPYARARDYSETRLMTAQQLALQELPAGWTLDWQIVDWTVPAKVYRYTGLTPLESIKRLVKSAGGWLYADPTEQVLHAVPKWPQKPWAWDFVPDMSLPSSYVMTESRQQQLGTPYDSILVCGGSDDGLAVLVTRAGTQGGDPASSVTDSLITDIEPAKGRAVQELADGWSLRQYSISLPLQAPPSGAGLIMPGATLDFVSGADGWRGMVTGTSISVSSSDITQTLEIVSP